MNLHKYFMIDSYYLHFRSHIYITQHRNDYILLDTKQNKYKILSSEVNSIVKYIVNQSEISQHLQNNAGKTLAEDRVLSNNEFLSFKALINNHVIRKCKTPFPYYIDHKPSSSGMPNIDWRLPLKNSSVNFSSEVFYALLTLIKVNFYIKIRGFYSTIQLIKQSHVNNKNYTIPGVKQLEDLANKLNKACLIYPTRTKCLEWAMTFVLIALKKGWKCNLEIGVQNYPFMAHAWVECNDKVVMDDQKLRKNMSIILNEPFRRLKI